MDDMPITVNSNKICGVAVKQNTLVRLKRLKIVKTESMDSVINRLMDGKTNEPER